MKESIKNTIKDLVASFLYYDRKEDEELQLGEIEDEVKAGNITVDDIMEEIRKQMESKLVTTTSDNSVKLSIENRI